MDITTPHRATRNTSFIKTCARAEKTEAQKAAAIEQGKRLAASRKAATEDPAAWLGLSAVLVTPSAARQPGDANVARVVAFGRYNPIRN